MNLMQSWKQSMQLLAPQNLIPFLLVTVKTVADTYKEMNRPHTSRSNWVLAGVIAFLIILSNIVKKWYMLWFEGYFLNGLRYALFFLFVLALRPSVAIKDTDYFKKYMHTFWPLLIAIILLGLTPIFAFPFLLMGYIFFLLFAFDGDRSTSSLLIAVRNSFTMILYNFPLCLAFEVILRIIGYILYKLVAIAIGYWGGLTIAAFLYLIFVPIEVAIITNLYIKLFHAQSELYLRTGK